MNLKAVVSSLEPMLGGWCGIPSSLVAEAVAAAGCDYVCADMQHGLVTAGDLVAMFQGIQRAGATALARVPIDDYAMAQRALDLGASGIIFPMVSTVEQATAAGEACHYPPTGQRSYGPLRSRLYFGDDLARADEAIVCLVMIETKSAVDRVAAILAAPGVDGVYVGPNDLALSLGLPPGSSPESMEAPLRTIVDACGERGLIAGIHASSGAGARYLADLGFRMISVGSDVGVLSNGYQAALAGARGAAGNEDTRATIYGR